MAVASVTFRLLAVCAMVGRRASGAEESGVVVACWDCLGQGIEAIKKPPCGGCAWLL